MSENIKVLYLIGPYRNLTTLVSTILSFHENIQVINHSFDKILKKYGDIKKESLIKFIKNDIKDPKNKKSLIENAHSIRLNNSVYKNKEISLLRKKSKKEEIKLIVLKDSGLVSEYIKKNPDFIKNENYFFIRPVRDYRYCIFSNCKANSSLSLLPSHYGGKENTLENFKEYYYSDIKDTYEMSKDNKNVSFIFENESFLKVFKFLKINVKEDYIKRSEKAFDSKIKTSKGAIKNIEKYKDSRIEKVIEEIKSGNL